MGNALNPCPFCESKAVVADLKVSKLSTTEYRFTHYVRCKACHARGPSVKANELRSTDKHKAIAAWNRGTDDEQR